MSQKDGVRKAFELLQVNQTFVREAEEITSNNASNYLQLEIMDLG